MTYTHSSDPDEIKISLMGLLDYARLTSENELRQAIGHHLASYDLQTTLRLAKQDAQLRFVKEQIIDIVLNNTPGQLNLMLEVDTWNVLKVALEQHEMGQNPHSLKYMKQALDWTQHHAPELLNKILGCAIESEGYQTQRGWNTSLLDYLCLHYDLSKAIFDTGSKNENGEMELSAVMGLLHGMLRTTFGGQMEQDKSLVALNQILAAGADLEEAGYMMMSNGIALEYRSALDWLAIQYSYAFQDGYLNAINLVLSAGADETNIYENAHRDVIQEIDRHPRVVALRQKAQLTEIAKTVRQTHSDSKLQRSKPGPKI